MELAVYFLRVFGCRRRYMFLLFVLFRRELLKYLLSQPCYFQFAIGSHFATGQIQEDVAQQQMKMSDLHPRQRSLGLVFLG